MGLGREEPAAWRKDLGAMDKRLGRQAAGRLIRASIADARLPAIAPREFPTRGKIDFDQDTRRDSRNSRIARGGIRANAFGPEAEARGATVRNKPSSIRWERCVQLHDQAR